MTTPSDPTGSHAPESVVADLVRQHVKRTLAERLDANAEFAISTLADEVARFAGTLVQIERGIRGQELVDRIVAHLRGLADGETPRERQ